MKKILIVFALALVSLVLVNGQAFAITGACSGCHTMHNSQDGAIMAQGTVYGDPAYPQLLRGNCLACHTVAGTFVATAPKVDTAIAGSMTAAGTFAAAVATTDSRKHNISVIALAPFNDTEDTIPGGVAPGGTFTQANLTCAGANGCHGDGSVAFVAGDPTGQNGIGGFHHGSVSGGPGYRFLKVRGDNNPSVLGTSVGGSGSADWEMGGATATNHNVYQGGGAGNTFSDFCNNCHPNFHGVADQVSGGAFVRHPTDWNIPASWDTIGTGITEDYTNNPFVWANTAGISTTAAYTFTAGNSQVGCVSCHRAHGSANPDILRFDYATQVAGGGNTVGCLGCHSAQR